jgi:hypothetical protein
METVLKIKLSDLDIDFVNAIKTLFKNNREIEITITSDTDFSLNKVESKKEYIDRLKKAAENMEKGNVVAFTEKEFNKLNRDLIGKR